MNVNNELIWKIISVVKFQRQIDDISSHAEEIIGRIYLFFRFYCMIITN